MKTKIQLLNLLLFLCYYVHSQTPPAPGITVYGSTVFCSTDMVNHVTLVSSASSGNFWSNGATSQSITVSSSGTFNVVQVVSGFTSSASQVVTITVFPMPNVSVNPIGPFCSDSPTLILQGMPAGGIFIGTGASNNAGNVFMPSVIPSGSNTILYYLYSQPFAYNSSQFLCSDTAAVRIFVDDCTRLNEFYLSSDLISLYPNPTSDLLSINIPQTIKGVRVVDQLGRELKINAAINDKSAALQLEALPAGIYFIEINLERQLVRKRFVKE